MILSCGHIRPGLVVQVVDKFGTIKASVPGLFSNQDAPDLLPPIYPWFHNCSNSFSKVRVDDEIWVMFFDDNPTELFYFRKDNIKEGLEDLLKDEYKQVEVLASVESGLGYAQLFFTDGTGWVLRKDSSHIQITKTGDIILDFKGNKHRQLSIDDNGISLGTTGGSAEPAVLGDRLTDTLMKLTTLMDTIKEIAASNPYTAPLSEPMEGPLKEFRDSIQKITSHHVTLD